MDNNETLNNKNIMNDYKYPDLSILRMNEVNVSNMNENLKEKAVILQKMLNVFGVTATVEHISQGPSVTRFELKPELGTSVRSILKLDDAIQLYLESPAIRIDAPIPGKVAIGIEIPNKEKKPVLIRDIIDSEEYKVSSSNLVCAVGKDITGKIIVLDFERMSNLIVAGTKGSGKRSFINLLMLSILYKSSPEDVRFIMTDTNMEMLSIYNEIPHMLFPVISEPEQACAALEWGVAEMMRRYKTFCEFSVRDLKSYNKMAARNGMKKLSHIVIIVNELANLMMVAQKDVEASIYRLTQLAGAVGIHLIVATQRPSVDVITGLIMHNMQSRMAFRVSSGVESRTILNTVGAEKLLGNGDMLFQPQGFNKPVRVQGAYVSDDEVNAVVNFIKENTDGDMYDNEVMDEIYSLERKYVVMNLSYDNIRSALSKFNEDAWNDGSTQGRDEEWYEGRVEAIINLMKNMKLNAVQAMDALGIQADERTIYYKIIMN